MPIAHSPKTTSVSMAPIRLALPASETQKPCVGLTIALASLPSHEPPVANLRKPAEVNGVPLAHMKNLSRPANRKPRPTTVRRTKIPRSLLSTLSLHLSVGGPPARSIGLRTYPCR